MSKVVRTLHEECGGGRTALQAAPGKQVDGEPGRRHHGRLETPGRAHEPDVVARVSPRASSSASASAGKTWPPVPPPLIRTSVVVTGARGARCSPRCSPRRGARCAVRGDATLAGHVHEDAGAGHGGDQRRPPERHERERDAGDGQESDDRTDVDDGLPHDPHGDARRDERAEPVGGAKRDACTEHPDTVTNRLITRKQPMRPSSSPMIT